jgi:hypothetical protein
MCIFVFISESFCTPCSIQLSLLQVSSLRVLEGSTGGCPRPEALPGLCAAVPSVQDGEGLPAEALARAQIYPRGCCRVL